MAHICSQYRCHEATVGLRKSFNTVLRLTHPWKLAQSNGESILLIIELSLSSYAIISSELPVDIVSLCSGKWSELWWVLVVSSSTESSIKLKFLEWLNDSFRCSVIWLLILWKMLRNEKLNEMIIENFLNGVSFFYSQFCFLFWVHGKVKVCWSGIVEFPTFFVWMFFDTIGKD